jgi:hypothetical protein
MGRYAFFNTGLEYKFKFAIQSSSDMLDFEGLSSYGGNDDEMYHSWKKTDEIKIKKTLDEYYEDKVDLTKFEKNLNGTYDLKEYLETITDIRECGYVLGYLIYHQLQYVDELSVKYEI